MSVAQVIGAIVFVLGAAIWIGNVSRIFPTVPLLGYLTMVIGGVIYKAGNNKT